MSVFTQVQHNRVDTNVFDLTHDRKFSCKMGQLIPICVMDTIPGDQFKINSSSMVRFAPLVAPVMHRANVFMHFFFVPNRILWKNWEAFITGGEDGLDVTVPPTIGGVDTDFPTGKLADYLGAPTQGDMEIGASMKISALPFSAYAKIYNDYYRDQNQEEEIIWELQDGDNGTGTGNVPFDSLMTVRNRAWQHDYFTSALPWTQRGPEAMLPLGTTAPLTPTVGGSDMQLILGATGVAPTGIDDVNYQPTSGTRDGVLHTKTAAQPVYVKIDDVYEADLSAATSSSIIELRRAFRLQEWLEKNARSGARYIEVIKSHFDVNSSDKRLQRAEYLGGLSSPVKISEVLQTSATASDVQQFVTPQGNMAGHGISVGGGSTIGHYSEEHGYIIGIMSIMPKSAYQNGIPKHFLREDKFDYPWPEFAHIGEQAIQNREIFVSANPDTNLETFGYTPRYSEYKFVNDSVHGQFRDILDTWHMGRKFSALPPLNNDFMKMQSDEVERIFAVQTGDDNMWIHVLNEIKAKRKMPVFGIPKI